MGLAERNVVSQVGFQAHAIAPNTTFTLVSDMANSTGASGDRLQRLVVNVLNPATALLSIIDGTREYPLIVPNAAVTPGPMQIELGIYSNVGAWIVRTGTGVSVVAIGSFS